jgi:hypothetical protein
VDVTCFGGSIQLQDNLTLTNVLTLSNGTLDLNNKNTSSTAFSSSNSNTRQLTMGSGTMTLTSTGTVWTMATATGLTVTANSSTIKLTDASASSKTFSGGGKVFNNIWLASGTGSGSYTIVGSNTFADFKDDGTIAHSIIFTVGTTQTLATFTVSGNASQLITLNSTTTGTFALVKTGNGTICRDYLNIQHSVATPSSTWYAGTNSTNNQATSTAGSGWTFTACPSSARSFGVIIN